VSGPEQADVGLGDRRPEASGWTLAVTADGLDSILSLGFLDRETARDLLVNSLHRELQG